MKKIICLLTFLLLLFSCTSITSLLETDSPGKIQEHNNKPGEVQEHNNKTTKSKRKNSLRVETPESVTERYDSSMADTALIAEAIKWGDCAFLFDYTQREDADINFVSQATRVLENYSNLDKTVSRYRTGKMNSRVRKVPQHLMEDVFIEPETTLPEVVSLLTNGISSSFLKVKILHDWICDNIVYDTEMYFSGSIKAQDYISVLHRKNAVCSGYTNLMNKMCNLAGIESIGINGYSKGLWYNGKIPEDTDHSWNAVKIGNKWYLVDVTWDAGIVDRRTFIKRYSSEWLFLDSRPFLYSHFPEENAYQYYAPVLTIDEFVQEPYIAGIFFQYGLALNQDKLKYDNLINGSFTFDISLQNSNISLSSKLRTANQKEINAATWGIREGKTVTFDFDVPDENEYVGHIFARYNNEVRLQEKIQIEIFENEWLPRVESLYIEDSPKESKITEEELVYFKNSYYKVEENGSYYFLEDQFDSPRNDAVLKIHKVLDLSTMWMENVLDFNICTAPDYPGYGTDVLKYPYTYASYHQARNTQLLSPLKGVLKAGTTENISLASSDYSKLGIWIDGDIVEKIDKDSSTGIFELTSEVPEGITELRIYGLKGKIYNSLIGFQVIE